MGGESSGKKGCSLVLAITYQVALGISQGQPKSSKKQPSLGEIKYIGTWFWFLFYLLSTYDALTDSLH